MRTLVVGSGPAAYAAALAIAARGGAVTLLTRQRPEGEPTFGEHLAPAAKVPLARLGIDALRDPRHRQSHGITATWGTDQPYTRDYLFNPHGCGWNLDRGAFDCALAREALRRGVELLAIARIEGVRQTGETWKVTVATSGGRVVVEGGFMIDATGRGAALARKLGVRCVRHDRLVGLYARLQATHCDDDHLLLETGPEGWWYSVPLADGALIAVYMTDSDLLPAGADARARHWLAQLDATSATRARTGRLREAPALHVAPAGSQCLAAHAGAGWLAIGDAAMAFDPLAAAGIAKALEDGLAAAALLEDASKGAWSPQDYSGMRWAEYDAYLKSRARHYALERRWACSPFWRRLGGPDS